MRRLKRSLPLAAAVVLLGLATVFALVAVDARAWQSTFARDDVRFRAHHSQSQVWSSPAILPGDPARAILGLGDSLAYRQALQNFWLNVVGIERAKGTDLAVTRLAAQTQLQQLANTASTTAERSSAANLLGVMTITTSASDDATLAQIYERATSYFQLAIQEDPANWAAKVNLELTLRLKRPAKSHFGADARGGFGQGGSEGTGPIGGGF